MILKLIKQVYYLSRYIMASMFCLLFRHSYNIQILDREQTVKKILKSNCSVCRFGDGEFGIIQNKTSTFQDANALLGKRLYECLENKNSNVLVCLPSSLIDDKQMNYSARRFWREYIFKNKSFLAGISKDRVFGDSLFTRFYMDRKDKYATFQYVSLLKKIWNNRHLLIVEGFGSRLGVGNDLFDNALSIQRILCPSTNAYAKYSEILTRTEEYCNKNKCVLVLCALGMTATVLAYDLSIGGQQAIDIGHIDVEYCWFKMGATEKCLIPSKTVNECGVNTVLPIENELYNKQIVCKIS